MMKIQKFKSYVQGQAGISVEATVEDSLSLKMIRYKGQL